MNFHIEVHTKDNQVEHYVLQNIESEEEARIMITKYFQGREFPIADSILEAMNDAKFQYYIFRIVALEDRPVVYITGEYRSNYPI